MERSGRKTPPDLSRNPDVRLAAVVIADFKGLSPAIRRTYPSHGCHQTRRKRFSRRYRARTLTVHFRRSTMTEQDRPAPERPANKGHVHSDVMAVLPLRDIVVFPHMIVPLFVGREKSVRALEAVMKDDKQ